MQVVCWFKPETLSGVEPLGVVITTLSSLSERLLTTVAQIIPTRGQLQARQQRGARSNDVGRIRF